MATQKQRQAARRNVKKAQAWGFQGHRQRGRRDDGERAAARGRTARNRGALEDGQGATGPRRRPEAPLALIATPAYGGQRLTAGSGFSQLPAPPGALTRHALAQKVFPLLAALSTCSLRPAEEVQELRVTVALGIVDIGLEPQRVAQGLFDEPDEVVVLVLRARRLSGFLWVCAADRCAWARVFDTASLPREAPFMQRPGREGDVMAGRSRRQRATNA